MVLFALKAQRSEGSKFGSHASSKGRLRLDPKVYEKWCAENLCYSCGSGDHFAADCAGNGLRRYRQSTTRCILNRVPQPRRT